MNTFMHTGLENVYFCWYINSSSCGSSLLFSALMRVWNGAGDILICNHSIPVSHLPQAHTLTHTCLLSPTRTLYFTLKHTLTHSHTHTHTFSREARCWCCLTTSQISYSTFSEVLEVCTSSLGLIKLSQLLFLRLFHSDSNVFTLKGQIREDADECKPKIMSFIVTDP